MGKIMDRKTLVEQLAAAFIDDAESRKPDGVRPVNPGIYYTEEGSVEFQSGIYGGIVVTDLDSLCHIPPEEMEWDNGQAEELAEVVADDVMRTIEDATE